MFNPLDNSYLYNIYDFNMRLLQPYSDYFDNLAKRFRRISDNINLPVRIPYMSDDEQNGLKKILGSNFRSFS